MTSPYFTTSESAERDERVLTRKKSNYAPRDETVELRWSRGVFVPPKLSGGGFFGTADRGKRRTAEEVFLDLLEALTSEGRSVSESVHAGNYAPRLFARRPDSDGFKRRYVHAVILGSEERQPLMDEDNPLPFKLPAVVLR